LIPFIDPSLFCIFNQPTYPFCNEQERKEGHWSYFPKTSCNITFFWGRSIIRTAKEVEQRQPMI
jgi:hypothetical protein